MTRRSGIRFDPLAALNLTEESLAQENIYQRFLTLDNQQQTDINLDEDLYPNEGYMLIHKFLHLRQLVMALDSLDIVGDSDDEAVIMGAANRSKTYSNQNKPSDLLTPGHPPLPSHNSHNANANHNTSNTNTNTSHNTNNPMPEDSSINDTIIAKSSSHQIAFLQGQTLRVEVDKLGRLDLTIAMCMLIIVGF